MRIFVAGATGAVGRHLLPRLVRAGHAVTGMTRTPAKAALVRDLGAEAVIVDALDKPAVQAAVEAARPEAVVHELTDLQCGVDLRNFDRGFAHTNRLCTDGTDNLLAAARSCGVQRFVAQSYCGWPSPARGGT